MQAGTLMLSLLQVVVVQSALCVSSSVIIVVDVALNPNKLNLALPVAGAPDDQLSAIDS